MWKEWARCWNLGTSEETKTNHLDEKWESTREKVAADQAKQTHAISKSGCTVQSSGVLTGFVAEAGSSLGDGEAADLLPLILLFIHTIRKALWAIVAREVVSSNIDLKLWALPTCFYQCPGSGAELLPFQREAGDWVAKSDERLLWTSQ